MWYICFNVTLNVKYSIWHKRLSRLTLFLEHLLIYNIYTQPTVLIPSSGHTSVVWGGFLTHCVARMLWNAFWVMKWGINLGSNNPSFAAVHRKMRDWREALNMQWHRHGCHGNNSSTAIHLCYYNRAMSTLISSDHIEVSAMRSTYSSRDFHFYQEAPAFSGDDNWDT